MANVVLSNVSKSYGSLEVIEGLNLAIEDGSFTVFVGPSGKRTVRIDADIILRGSTRRLRR